MLTGSYPSTPMCPPHPPTLGNSVSFFNCSLSLLSVIIKRDSMLLFHDNSPDINMQRKEQQQWQKWGHKSVVWCITAFDRLATITHWQRKQIYVIPAELNDYILTGRNALLNPHFSQPDGRSLTLVSSDQIKRTETRPSHESLQGCYGVRTDTVCRWRPDIDVLFPK